MTTSGTTTTYAYNGLGDRVSQTVSGVTTRYTLDPNARLSQMLVDGTITTCTAYINCPENFKHVEGHCPLLDKTYQYLLKNRLAYMGYGPIAAFSSSQTTEFLV
jgi:YD repeat-containing protein